LTAEALNPDGLIECLTQPDLEFVLVMNAVGHQQFAYSNDHSRQNCQQGQCRPQQCSQLPEYLAQTIHLEVVILTYSNTTSNCSRVYWSSRWKRMDLPIASSSSATVVD